MPSRLARIRAQVPVPLYRFSLALLPALIVFIATAFTEITPVNQGAKAFLLWTPFEFGAWAVLAFGGIGWEIHTQMRSARAQLKKANEAEETRRVVAAIGVAASWDLDLNRLYQRVSQDLRSILDFDRFTITVALPTGRMKIEFVSGDPEDGLVAGAILSESPDEPDGLHASSRSKYGSRLTAAIPACNGAMTIRRKAHGQYDPVHLDLLRQAIAQISPGIANAIVFKSSERRVRERTVLADIGRAATSASDPRKIITAVDAALKKLVDYDHLGVILTDERDERHESGILTYWSQAGLSGWNVGDRVPFRVDTVSQSEVISGTGLGISTFTDSKFSQDTSPRAWLQAPLVFQEKLIGTLVLSSPDPETLGQEESELLLNVSLQIAPAIENAKLTASLKRQADERRAIAAVGLAANSELNLEAIYKGLARELARVIQYDRLSISYVSPEDGQREIAFTTGVEVEGYGGGDVLPPSENSSAPYESGSNGWSSVSASGNEFRERSGLKSRTSARLGTSPNILGTLQIGSFREDAYDAQDTELLERVAAQVTPAIKNARMIAAERELRETLDRQNTELYEANNARKQFLSTVSHELKTPLTIISGFVDLLASPGGSDDEDDRQESLNIIRRNADQLDVLINDILDISRLDGGNFKIDPRPFPVNSLVSDLEASFQSLLRTKAQTLTVDVAEDELWINADRARISQVITNLLSNASKYSPDSTEITMRCQVDGERLHIMVEDRGMGMSEEEQKGLFTAFFRADNEVTRTVSGTGLGLVIAKSITELHGGEIALESQTGKGTKIEFWLPGLMTKEAAEAEMPEPQAFTGSRLWPDRPPEELGLGAD